MKCRTWKKILGAAALAVSLTFSGLTGTVSADDIELEFQSEEELDESENMEILSDEEEFLDFLEEDFQAVMEENIAENYDDEIALFAVPESFVQEGQPVREGNEGFIPVKNGEAIFDSKYTRLGWNADSEVIPWSQAGENVVQGRRVDTSVCGPYFVPLNDSAKGKFGFRITHAGYNKEANTKVDLLLTCTDYEDYTFDYKGNKVTDVYPMFGMRDSKSLWILFKQELPMQEIKVDIVQSGTNTPVAGNYRFRWLDIDAYQRFGICLQNGTICQKYVTTDSVVNVLKQTLFGKTYDVLTAPAEEVKGEVPQNTVAYEIEQSSGFYLTILMPGYTEHSVVSKNTIKSVFEQVKSGTIQETSGLNWDSKAYGPVEYPNLMKKTGNELKTQSSANELASSTDSYFYTLQTDIPEEQKDYYYNVCEIEDRLPDGADYNGYAAVKLLPSESDVSSWFQISSQDDVIKFEATSAALKSEEFYGKTLEFQIGVKMDPTEIIPVYNGDQYRYEVKNKASITCRHKNEIEGTSWSNEVTTGCTVMKNRITDEKLQKFTAKSGDNDWQTELLLDSTADSYKYMLSVQVPQNEIGGYLEKLVLTDELPDGAEDIGQNVAVYQGDTEVTEWFQLTKNKKKLVAEAKQEALENGEFYGKTYDFVWLVKMNTEELTPSYNEDIASYAVKNRFTVASRQIGDTKDLTAISNEVTDRAETKRPALKNPEKWILHNGSYVTSCEYEKKDFEAVFEIQQEVPEYDSVWTLQGIKLSDALEECLELKAAVLFADNEQIAVFDPAREEVNGWKLEIRQNLVELTSGKTFSNNFCKKTMKLRLTVGLKDGCSLQKYYVKGAYADVLEAQIFNAASSTCTWKAGTPSSETKKTDQVEVIIKEPIEKGKIEIEKTDENGELLESAVFEIAAAQDIYSASGNLLLKEGTVADTVVTGEDGTGMSKELYLGKYRIRETKAPKGYVLNASVQNAEISSTQTNKKITFVNEKTQVKLRKIKERELETEPIEGIKNAEFLLWKKGEDKNTGSRYVSDPNGWIVIEGLFPGTYQFQEIAAPDGYLLNSETTEFIVDESGKVENENGHVFFVENTYTKAEFSKVDKGSGKLLAGATLQLKDDTGKVVDTWVTTLSPHRINGLKEGNYTLSELKAPENYEKGEDVTCVITRTGAVQKFQIENIKMVTITLYKKLHEEEVVWAQGNPVFTFVLEGEDLEGRKQSYTDMVEFTEEKQEMTDGWMQKVVFIVPAGRYTAREEKTIRFEFEKIEQVVNGTVSADSVTFDLRENQNGEAVFVNQKTTDRELTDTELVRNVVVSSK